MGQAVLPTQRDGTPSPLCSYGVSLVGLRTLAVSLPQDLGTGRQSEYGTTSLSSIQPSYLKISQRPSLHSSSSFLFLRSIPTRTFIFMATVLFLPPLGYTFLGKRFHIFFNLLCIPQCLALALAEGRHSINVNY